MFIFILHIYVDIFLQSNSNFCSVLFRFKMCYSPTTVGNKTSKAVNSHNWDAGTEECLIEKWQMISQLSKQLLIYLSLWIDQSPNCFSFKLMETAYPVACVSVQCGLFHKECTDDSWIIHEGKRPLTMIGTCTRVRTLASYAFTGNVAIIKVSSWLDACQAC